MGPQISQMRADTEHKGLLWPSSANICAYLRLIAVALAFSRPACAAETEAFLMIPVDARGAALGGADTALANDSSAIYWNPAGLSRDNQPDLGLDDAEMYADTRYDYASLSAPTRWGTVGAGFGYLSQGTIDGRDENRQPTGSFTASDSVFTLGLGRRIGGGLSLGAGVEVVDSKIANVEAQDAALNLGADYDFRFAPVSLGFAVQNLGPGMQFLDQTNQLPLTLALGMAYRLPVGLDLIADIKERPYSDDFEYDFGTEYTLLAGFALRAGYTQAPAAQQTATSGPGVFGSGLGIGVGVKVAAVRMDYAFTPYGELGDVQRISLSLRW
jgi:long-subunit fatty acid transport protein